MEKTAAIAPDIQTVIWDLDGTLLDSFGIYRDCLNEALRMRGRPEAPEAILRNHHHGFIDDSIVNVLKDMKQDIPDAEMTGIIKDFYRLDNDYIKDVDHHLFEDAVDLAERTHRAGKRQIVVTNRPHGVERGNGSPRNLVYNSRLRNLIDDVLCGDDSAYRKPERGFLESRFGADLSELGNMVVVGDQFVDGEFARNLGCRAILVQRTEAMAHLERLGDWRAFASIVPSLRGVHV